MKIAYKPHNKNKYGGAKALAFALPQTPNTIVAHALAEMIDFDEVDTTGWDFVNSKGWGAHFYVYPTGLIVNSIPSNIMGAHAKGHNMDTVGIEFIVPGLHTFQSFTKAIDNIGWMSLAQTEAGIWLCNNLIEADGSKIKYLTSHRHLSPERKSDPGDGFPYREFIDKVDLPEKNINF